MSRAIPSNYPTTSDIGTMMQSIGYQWSNEAQCYYNTIDYDRVSRKMAERVYTRFIGAKPYYETLEPPQFGAEELKSQTLTEAIEKLEELEVMSEVADFNDPESEVALWVRLDQAIAILEGMKEEK